MQDQINEPTFLFSSMEQISSSYNSSTDVALIHGNSMDALSTIPNEEVQLIITSPPYNIGKAYEKATALDDYLSALEPIIEQLIRTLSPRGSLCWQVGNYV